MKNQKCLVFALAVVLAVGVSFAQSVRTVSVADIDLSASPVVTLNVSFGTTDCDLYLATGMSDGGAATDGWNDVMFVKTVTPFESSVSCPMPDGWGDSYTHFRFFVLYDPEKTYSNYLPESVTSSGSQHVDTGIIIDSERTKYTRSRIVMSAPNTTWPVNGISGKSGWPYFFFGPGQGATIWYGWGNSNASTSKSYTWGHKAVFDFDGQNKTFKVTDLSTTPETTVVDMTISLGATSGSATFWLFGYNGELAQRTMTIYSADFWYLGEPIASFVPAVSNGVACLFETFQQKYFLPMNKAETAVAPLTANGKGALPEPSSSSTFETDLHDPIFNGLSVGWEDGAAVIRGTLVFCGKDASACDLRLRYGFAADDLCNVSTLTTGQGTGNFSLPAADLLPNRHYFLAVEAVNASGASGLSEVLEFVTPALSQSGERARAFEIIGLTPGPDVQAKIAFADGPKGTLTLVAGGETIGNPVEIPAGAREVTVPVPVDATTGRLRPDVEFHLSNDVYGYLVESISSVAASLSKGCVDMGVTVTPQNFSASRLKVTLATSQSGDWNVVGHSSPQNGAFFVGFDGSGRLAYGYGSTQSGGGYTYNWSDKMTLDLNFPDRTFTATDESLNVYNKCVYTSSFTPGTPPGSMSILLHGWNQYYRQQTIYHASFWQNDALVRDLWPCVDGTGVACYYDAVSTNLIYSTGTGDELQPGAQVVADVFAGVRHVLTPIRSDVPCLVRANIAFDMECAGSLVLSGCLSQFGSSAASDCTLTLVLDDGKTCETKTLGAPNADGSFSFAPSGLRPDTTYAWQLRATAANGNADALEGEPFTTPGSTVIASVTRVTTSQRQVFAHVEFEKFGIGETLLYAFWGPSAEAMDHSVLIGCYTSESNKFDDITFNLADAACDAKTAFRIVASNFVGTASATSAGLDGEVTLKDGATYTWKGGEGRWTDDACWTANKEDNWGHPDSANCGVVFPAGDSVVELEDGVVSKTVNFGPSGANVKLWGTDASRCRYTCCADTTFTIPAAVTVTVDRASVAFAAKVQFGRGTAFRATNGAQVDFHDLELYGVGDTLEISRNAGVSVVAFAMTDATLVIDDAQFKCMGAFYLNKFVPGQAAAGKCARLVLRGKHPLLRFYGSGGPYSFSNISVAGEGVVDFEVPPGGYAEAPIQLPGTQKTYPFGSFEDYGGIYGPQTTPITLRLANRRGTLVSQPALQPLVTWSSGIATNFVNLARPYTRAGEFLYSDDTSRPKSLLLKRNTGFTVIIY